MVKHVSEFHAHLKPPMQIKATKQDSIKCFNTREKTAFTCSKAIGELTSELEAKFKIKKRLVQVPSMGVPLKVFRLKSQKLPIFQTKEWSIE